MTENPNPVGLTADQLASLHEALAKAGKSKGGRQTSEQQLRRQLAEVEAERDGAYRERARLVAWLAAIHPAVLTPAPDVDEDGWQILYLTAGGHQLSWHIAPSDADLFGHVRRVPGDDPRAQWDGHTTEEKYERIRPLLLAAAPDGPAEQSTCTHPITHIGANLPRLDLTCRSCGVILAEHTGDDHLPDLSWLFACPEPRCMAIRLTPCMRWDGSVAAVSHGARWDRYDRALRAADDDGLS